MNDNTQLLQDHAIFKAQCHDFEYLLQNQLLVTPILQVKGERPEVLF